MPRVKLTRTIENRLWVVPNNVETYANVPLIVRNGVEGYHSIEIERSPGTKAFAITCNAGNTGLLEMPVGIPIRKMVFDIGVRHVRFAAARLLTGS